MAPPTRKFNPGFLTDDELVASYCVRTTEFDLLVEVLRECTGHSNAHQIVIGPRGSGKTSLLLRVAAEVGRDAALESRLFPIVFAEESYEVGTAGEFWLECLTNLATQATRREDTPDLHRTVDELRVIRDDQALTDRCLGAVLDFADREGKRLLLLVENLNMLFRDMADPDAAGWRLRKILQTEPRIIVFASATSRFDEIDNPDRALYDLFRVRTLRPLDTKQCAVLWETVSGRSPVPAAVRSLEILTGGSPRLISIVASFGAGLSFRDLMAHLLDLVDDHTEYFKGHLESLPAQERRVYLALATLWKPATTREIADHARLETSTCSAQLARLGDRGVVQVAGGSARRKQYYLTERLYNIYYLMRRRRGPDRFVEALIHFMESYYSPTELKDISAGMVHDVAGLGEDMQSLHRIALASLMKLPSLAEYREELLETIPTGFVAVSGRESAPVDVTRTTAAGVQTDGARVEPSKASPGESTERAAQEFFEATSTLHVQNSAEDTVAVCDELVRRFGDSEIPGVLRWVAKALVNRGAALSKLNRPEDALVACDEVVRRFRESETPGLLESVASALVNKAATLGELNRPQDAVVACDEVIRRFGESENPGLPESVASALVNKGVALGALNRLKDALATWGEVIRRFGESESPGLLEPVAKALANKGEALDKLNRPEDALVVCDEVVRRFWESENPVLLKSATNALVNKGAVLDRLNRPQDALEAWDRVVRRFGESETSDLVESVATALVNKGAVLHTLNRPEDALAAWDEVIRRFGKSETPGLVELVANTLANKGGLFHALNRPEDALAAWEEVIRRFGKSETPGLVELVAKTLVNKGAVLHALNRPEDALVACDEVARRFGESETPVLREAAAKALVNKGAALGALNRSQDALAAWDEMIRRFGDNKTTGVLELVVSTLANKGAVLGVLNRPEDALSAWDEVVRRVGKRETPVFLELVAKTLIGRGAMLQALNRPEDALVAYDEVVRRFGESATPALLHFVARALVNKGAVLGALNRPEDALVACDEVVHRFGKSETPDLLESVANVLVNKGVALGALNRPGDALVAYDEVVRRFGESEIPALYMGVQAALLGRAGIEIKSRQYEQAAETATRAIEHPRAASEQRFQGHVVRARALLAGGGDRAACEPDVAVALALLSELRPIPREVVMVLMDFSVALGPQRMYELIQASPSPSQDLLLPLTTALERELGLDPRVAREVDEVAQDVQRTLAELKANRTRQVDKRDD